jgi:uncharacterized HhH-GPD family protein
MKGYNAIEFFYGVIFDQGIPADRAWNAPSELKKRIHHLDPHRIAKMKEKSLRKAIRHRKALHRFPNIMANYLIESSKLLVDRYRGKPENIWNDNPRAEDLQWRFDEFKGIGQKKSSMATNILVRHYGLSVRGINRRGIDVSSDMHVRRVFLRTGIIDRDSVRVTVDAARKLNPEYPGELDLPAWYIGRDFCHPKDPSCDKCPLTRVCSKRVNLNASAA